MPKDRREIVLSFAELRRALTAVSSAAAPYVPEDLSDLAIVDAVHYRKSDPPDTAHHDWIRRQIGRIPDEDGLVFRAVRRRTTFGGLMANRRANSFFIPEYFITGMFISLCTLHGMPLPTRPSHSLFLAKGRIGLRYDIAFELEVGFP